MAKGVKLISALMEGEEHDDRLMDATRRLCKAFSDLLDAAKPENNNVQIDFSSFVLVSPCRPLSGSPRFLIVIRGVDEVYQFEWLIRLILSVRHHQRVGVGFDVGHNKGEGGERCGEEAIQSACHALSSPRSTRQQVLSAATVIAEHTSSLCNACNFHI